eukprot:327737_1
MGQSYAPVQAGEDEEESMAFIPVADGNTYTSSYDPNFGIGDNSNSPPLPSNATGMIVPPTSETNVALQGMPQPSATAVATAVPVPNTIRPPRVIKP